jgi:WD repeat-containing protein mio
VVINRDGDLEVYSVHDTPSNCSWSQRGELYLALGTSYRIFSPPKHPGSNPNPWEVPLLHKNSREVSAGRKEQTGDDDQSRSRGRSQSLVSPPTFGRGDEDGFPALSATLLKSALDTKRTQRSALDGISLPPSLGRRSAAVTRAPSLRDLRATAKMQAAAEEPPRAETPVQSANADKLADLDLDLEKDPQFVRPSGTERSSQQSAYQKLRQVLQGDISTIMRWRATKGYGLSNVSFFTSWVHIETLTELL